MRKIKGVRTPNTGRPSVKANVAEPSAMHSAQILSTDDLYKSLFEFSPLPSWIFDVDTHEFLEVNVEACMHYGYTKEEFLAMSVLDIRPPEDRDAYFKGVQQFKADRKLKNFGLFRHIKKDGDLIYVEISGYLFTMQQKNCGLVVAKDVTQRLSEEHTLKMFKSIIDHSHEGLVISEFSTKDILREKIIYTNERFSQMSGYASGEVQMQTLGMLIGPRTNKEVVSRVSKAFRTNNTYETDIVLYKKSGEEFWCNIHVSPVFNSFGHCTHHLFVGRDISPRKLSELKQKLMGDIAHIFNYTNSIDIALSEVLIKIAAMGQFTTAEAWLVDSDENKIRLAATLPITKKLKSYYDLTGITTSFDMGESLVGTAWKEAALQVWSIADETTIFKSHEAAAKWGLRRVVAIPIINNDEVIGVIVLGITDERVGMGGFKGLLQDLAPFLAAEIDRKQLEFQLADLFHYAPDFIVSLGFDGYFRRFNAAGAAMLEYTESELMSLPIESFVHPDDWERTTVEFNKLVSGQKIEYFENRYITKSGKVIWLSWSAKVPMNQQVIFGVAKDVTRQKQLEKLLDKASELAGLGAWEWDVVSNEVVWSLHLCNMNEVLPDFKPKASLPFAFACRHVSDEQRISKALRKAKLKGEPFQLEMQVVGAQRSIKWIKVIGEAELLQNRSVRVYGSVQDITQQKAAEDALRDANLSFSLAANASGIGMWQWYLGTSKITWDENMLIMYGLKQSEFDYTIQSWVSLIHPNDVDQVKADSAKAIENEAVFDSKYRIIRKDGEIRHIRAFGEMVSDLQNNKKRLIGICIDVTDIIQGQLKAQKALDERNAILESITDGFVALNRDWVVTYRNAAAENITGVPTNSLIGKNLWEVYGSNSDNPIYQKFLQAIEQQKKVHLEIFQEKLNKWLDINVYPSMDGLSVFYTDVTERIKAEEALRISNERFERAVTATNDAVWEWDVTTGVTYISPTYANAYGNKKDDSINDFENWSSRIHPDDREAIVNKLFRTIADPEVNILNEDYRYIKPDGQMVYINDRAFIYRDAEGKALKVTGAMQDISLRKDHEKKLNQINEALQKTAEALKVSNAELEHFAYVASHDLQEPLRMISSFLSLLEEKYDGKLDEKGKQYIHFAVDGAKRMRQLILDLLEYSRVGRTEDKWEMVNLNILIQEVMYFYKTKINALNAVVQVDDMPTIQTFSAPIYQVFQNLLSNSLKYHKPDVAPAIHIGYEETDTHWKFFLADNGIGIESEYASKVFVIFQRLHNRQEYSGTGIGLAIAKKIVETLGGEIWIESTPGVGSTFYFTIQKSDAASQ